MNTYLKESMILHASVAQGIVFFNSLKEQQETNNRRATVENKAILLSMHSTWLDKLSSSKFPQKEETLKLFPTDTKYYTLYFK